MKYERVQPEEAATIEQGHDTPQITYGDLLEHVRERRRVELEAEHPGRNSNLNAVSNTTRSLTAFMEANDLAEVDVVGEELIGTTPWDRAVKALGIDSTAKRRKAEMNARVRPWAMELIRAAASIFDDESFGERLHRLREAAGLSRLDLAKAIVRGNQKPDRSKIRNWEEGIKHPRPESSGDVASIENALRVPLGTLAGKMPNAPHKALSQSTGLPNTVQRRVAAHLPPDFNSMPIAKQDEILGWISENILSTPKEVLEDHSTKEGASIDLSMYSLARVAGPKSQLRLAPAHLIDELDEIQEFKTTNLLPPGMKRKTSWGPVSANKADEAALAFMGALHQMGLPREMLSLSVVLCPQVIDSYIEWKRKRRGGYTRSIVTLLLLIESLVHPETGFLTQSPSFGLPLQPVKGLITGADVRLADKDWPGACARAKAHLRQRVSEVEAASEKGRDPFEALLPVLEANNPLTEYYKIVHEVRNRMPDNSYPTRKAEAMRSLMMLRMGLALALRQKNKRELVICLPGQPTRSWKELKRLRRGEMAFIAGQWVVRIPGVAFKNAYSSSVHEENVLILADLDGLYAEIKDYLEARQVLLKGYADPGTFFVKTMRTRAQKAEYCQNGYYQAYRATITTYGIYNPYTGRGAIKDLRPHGPHSARHVIATSSVKESGGYSKAAALLLDSEVMIKQSYARFLPGERHALASEALWGSMFDEGDAA